jgi:Tfp pilus assembly protein PilX
MSVMADNRPGDTDMHRRQRGKNLIVAAFLLVLVVVFFALTIVRMGPQG